MADWDLISSYAGLLTLAVGSIYVGSFGSLPTAQQTRKQGHVTDGEDDDDIVLERVSAEDAWLFPVMGSGILLSLYAVVKYFGTEWINWFLGLYFSVTGVMSVWKSLISLAKYTLGSDRWKQFNRYQLTVRRGKEDLISVSWRTPTILLFPLGATPSIIYTFWTAERKSALLTDILALSFSHNALSLLRIDSFKTGCILLSGLFIYDVWWVFGTDVMVNVATTLDVPIKLLWAKSLTFESARGFTMLGLGDIVIPGTFVALALRYDHHRHSSSVEKACFNKPYFYTSLSAYIIGLVTTIMVMHTFKSAQPALLYLSPACILSFIITALVRGEFKAACDWSDDALEKPSVPGQETSEASPKHQSGLGVAKATDGDSQQLQEGEGEGTGASTAEHVE